MKLAIFPTTRPLTNSTTTIKTTNPRSGELLRLDPVERTSKQANLVCEICKFSINKRKARQQCYSTKYRGRREGILYLVSLILAQSPVHACMHGASAECSTSWTPRSSKPTLTHLSPLPQQQHLNKQGCSWSLRTSRNPLFPRTKASPLPRELCQLLQKIKRLSPGPSSYLDV